MRINHNISAINTFRQYNANTAKAGKSMEKLSSGLRINRAADDAAGLSISEKMRGEIAGITQKIRNTQDGISKIQTAEGALNEVSDMLVRMKELIIQKGNETYGIDESGNINLELTELGNSISSILSGTQFNGTAVLGNVTFTTVSSTSSEGDINTGIQQINTARAKFGAEQNRMEHEINNYSTYHENLQAAESRIRDVDMAEEMMEYTKNNILVQAAQSMLAQANQQPMGILQLLQ
ncbi:MAG TPA: flagellin [Ruminococcaceae bacterium]|jgi:flagellin|nr:flagellin [Oscillospiraceae bacterium]